ncbi:MAG: DMT family transporter [Alphaproteobacteria bacterium]|nr:DMT family transporter [Alphaproteobacteria bacterium]MBU1527106.1 DMT family transporter [Alphaproteobacteria bacterium]MBU2117539.1 DMT family transporter [Alphaproteobacteria bacterium]MBU2350698.1 DMT family transporter [Alphaproteobacteria bacterium]MBU2383315.1 DMT family transporter [Alphaproteobacteria bacterium]
MNANLFAMFAVFAAGAAAALQGPTNARLAQGVAAPVNAALISFAVGTATLLVLALAMQQRPEGQAVREVPGWAWIGGLYGALFVVVLAWATPKLGVATSLAAVVAGQLVLGLLIDHFGLMGVPRQPISLARLGGTAMVIGGMLLVRRG